MERAAEAFQARIETKQCFQKLHPAAFHALHKAKEELEKQVRSLQQELKDVKSVKHKQDQKLVDLKSTNKTMEQTIASYNAQNNDAGLRIKYTELEMEHKRVQEAIKTLEKKYTKLETEQKRLQKVVKDKDVTISSREFTIKKLKEEIGGLKSKIARLEENYGFEVNLVTANGAANALLEEKEEKTRDLQAKVDELQHKVNNLEENLAFPCPGPGTHRS